MHIMRRIRGSLKTGLTWAVAWGCIGVILAPLYPANISAESASYVRRAFVCGTVSGVYGFLAGSVFAAFVMFSGRRRALEELSLPKFGMWSVLASLLFTFPPTLFVVTQRHSGWDLGALAVLAGGAVLCAGSSVGSLFLAKRGARIEQSRDSLALSAVPSTAATPERRDTVRAKTEQSGT